MIHKISTTMLDTQYDTSEQKNSYTQYFPIRDSKGSMSLSLTVTNPSCESLSKNKSLQNKFKKDHRKYLYA